MIRSRLAPTPSGYLHAGNALNFMLCAALLKEKKGCLLLRIDDLDLARTNDAYLLDIFETLHWLQIEWQEGPVNAEEHRLYYSQLGRLPRYEQLIQQLAESGMVYACRCSRSQVQARSPNGLYPGTCRHLGIPLDEPDTALRLHVPPHIRVTFYDQLKGALHIDLSNTTGDFIIRRRDKIPAYHIASLADDRDFNINCIVRGEDLLESTAAQLFIARLCNIDSFMNCFFFHHPLLLNTDGLKLSKSAGHSPQRLSDSGLSPEQIKKLLPEFDKLSRWPV